jgi:hypothetical protein
MTLRLPGVQWSAFACWRELRRHFFAFGKKWSGRVSRNIQRCERRVTCGHFETPKTCESNLFHEENFGHGGKFLAGLEARDGIEEERHFLLPF